MISGIDLSKNDIFNYSINVNTICKPLFNLLNINYFCFYRVYESWYRLVLASSFEWPLNFFKKGYFYEAKMERHLRLYKSGYTLLGESIEHNGPRLIAADARKNFDIDHWLAVVKAYGAYVDVFEFTLPVKYKQSNLIYLNNLENIEKFIRYWMVKAIDLIKIAEKSKFYIPLDNILFLSDDESGLQINESLAIFNTQTEISLCTMQLNGKIVKFSKREMECLSYITKGYTIKQIARYLNLSPRIIDTYLENIKLKTECQTKIELIEMFHATYSL